MAVPRVYHFHVRKTAGTSLNAAFWRLGGLSLDDFGPTGERYEGNGRTFVRGNKALIEGGDYFYASSHRPAHELMLPEDTFTVTILRDPLERALSYFRYLRWAKADPDGDDPAMRWVLAEARCLEPSLVGRLRGRDEFENFLARVPKHRLMAQLWMFSKAMRPEEAAAGALACDAVCFTESFHADLQRLGSRLDLELGEHRERRTPDVGGSHVGERQVERLRERLAPEYEMFDAVRAGSRLKLSAA